MIIIAITAIMDGHYLIPKYQRRVKLSKLSASV
jgi:hypothetical protein